MRCTCPNKPAGVPCCLTAKVGAPVELFIGRRIFATIAMPKAQPEVQITEADEAVVSTATDYGAIVYPPGMPMYPADKTGYSYRVVSLSRDVWIVECMAPGYPSWVPLHRNTYNGEPRYPFANPQSAYAWLEETGRV